MKQIIDELALNRPLTTELLIEKVFSGCKQTLKIWIRKKQLIHFIDKTVKTPMTFSNNKQLIIYCMLRLWDEGRVDDWDFKSAWQKESLFAYKIWYYRYINEKQQQTIVV